jgi:hypothetical protein
MNIKKWLRQMSDEKKKDKSIHPARSTEPERDERGHPETNFLPPLKMFLTFFDKEARQKKKKKQEDSDEKKVEKLIEKLESEKDKKFKNDSHNSTD